MQEESTGPLKGGILEGQIEIDFDDFDAQMTQPKDYQSSSKPVIEQKSKEKASDDRQTLPQIETKKKVEGAV